MKSFSELLFAKQTFLKTSTNINLFNVSFFFVVLNNFNLFFIFIGTEGNLTSGVSPRSRQDDGDTSVETEESANLQTQVFRLRGNIQRQRGL